MAVTHSAYPAAPVGYSQTAEPPKTLSSAASRLDDLNARLLKAHECLSMISAQLGALTPVPCAAKTVGVQEIGGAVYRLNQSAEQAHQTLCEIDDLISGIARSLG